MARTITPSDTLARNRTVADALHRFCEGFIDKLDTGRVLEDVLPCYILALLCYQRLYAGALSRSLHAGASPPRISVREYFLRV